MFNPTYNEERDMKAIAKENAKQMVKGLSSEEIQSKIKDQEQKVVHHQRMAKTHAFLVSALKAQQLIAAVKSVPVGSNVMYTGMAIGRGKRIADKVGTLVKCNRKYAKVKYPGEDLLWRVPISQLKILSLAVQPLAEKVIQTPRRRFLRPVGGKK